MASFYIIEDNIELSNRSQYGSSPLKAYEKFHSQFQLKLNQYRDNNNFLQYNHVETNDNRIVNLHPGEFDFLNIDVGPVWTSTSYKYHHNTSYDGINYKEEKHNILFGTYFFLSNVRVDHHRFAFKFIDLLTNLGGIQALSLVLLTSLGEYINTQLYMRKMMNELHYVKMKRKPQG